MPWGDFSRFLPPSAAGPRVWLLQVYACWAMWRRVHQVGELHRSRAGYQRRLRRVVWSGDDGAEGTSNHNLDHKSSTETQVVSYWSACFMYPHHLACLLR